MNESDFLIIISERDSETERGKKRGREKEREGRYWVYGDKYVEN